MERYNSEPQLDGTISFYQWADTWYEGMKGQVSDTTYDGYSYLDLRLREGGVDRRVKSGQIIRAGNENILYAPVF